MVSALATDSLVIQQLLSMYLASYAAVWSVSCYFWTAPLALLLLLWCLAGYILIAGPLLVVDPAADLAFFIRSCSSR